MLDIEQGDPVPADLTTTLSFNSVRPAKCHFDLKGPFDLAHGQSLIVRLSGFPAASSMSFLALRSRQDPTMGVVFFPSQPGIKNTEDFRVSASSSGSPLPAMGLVVTITANDGPMTDRTFDLIVHGNLGGSNEPWQSDPEMIRKAVG